MTKNSPYQRSDGISRQGPLNEKKPGLFAVLGILAVSCFAAFTAFCATRTGNAVFTAKLFSRSGDAMLVLKTPVSAD